MPRTHAPEPPTLDLNAVAVLLQPIGAGTMPTCEHHGSVPVVTWAGEGFFARLDLQLGNLDDAGDYLRRLSRTLAAFAHDVEAAALVGEPGGRTA